MRWLASDRNAPKLGAPDAAYVVETSVAEISELHVDRLQAILAAFSRLSEPSDIPLLPRVERFPKRRRNASGLQGCVHVLRPFLKKGEIVVVVGRPIFVAVDENAARLQGSEHAREKRLL